jgi:hypothetical protein
METTEVRFVTRILSEFRNCLQTLELEMSVELQVTIVAVTHDDKCAAHNSSLGLQSSSVGQPSVPECITYLHLHFFSSSTALRCVCWHRDLWSGLAHKTPLDSRRVRLQPYHKDRSTTPALPYEFFIRYLESISRNFESPWIVPAIGVATMCHC